MIKIYGMPTCPYCDFVHEQIKGREDEFECEWWGDYFGICAQR